MTNTEISTLYVSEESYPLKPTGKLVGYIQSHILENKVDLTPLELAKEVAVLGKAVKLCNLPNGAKNLKSTPIINQRVLMVDIDNEHTEYPIFTIEDALKDDFILENAAFIYETSSSTKGRPKFRIVLILDIPFTHNRDVENAYEWLIKKYPQSDSKCRETTRLFFGSTKGFIEINFSNKVQKNIFLATGQVKEERIKTTKRRLSSFNKPIITANNCFVYNLLLQNNIKDAKKVIIGKNLGYSDMVFNTLEDFKVFILTDEDVSMSELLDLPNQNPFHDIFHVENDPSAGIFRTTSGSVTNVELYKCFSDSFPFNGNIIQVVSKLTNLNVFESTLLLKDLLNIRITNDSEYTHLEKVKEQAKEFMLLLENETLIKKYHNLGIVLKNYNEVIYFILDKFLTGNVYFNPVRKKYEIYNNIAVRKLIPELKKGKYGYALSYKKMYTILSLMTLLGIITKKVDAEIPVWLRDNLYTYRSINKHDYRLEVYSLESLSRYKLKNMEKMASQLIKDKVSVSKLNYDYIFNTFNKKTADRTYISNSSEHREVSDKLQYIEQNAVKLILNTLKKKQYITEKNLIERLQNNINRNPDLPNLTQLDIKDCIVKCRVSMCDKYGLMIIALTKTNQEKYHITDVPKGKRPTVYMLDT